VILFIADHWVTPEQLGPAERFIDARSQAYPSQPGFLWRYRLTSAEDLTKLTTVTAWTSAADLDAYRQLLQDTPTLPQFPWLRTSSETYEVSSEWGSSPVPVME
jgi:hypothetical protein